MKKLNLGCGNDYKEGWINLDIGEKNVYGENTKADVFWDLNNYPYPFENNEFSFIFMRGILEHIKNLIPLMNEIYRVMKPGGELYISVPQNEGIWADPTHVRGFSKISWRYYCDYPFSEMYGIKTHFKEVFNKFINNEDGGVLQVVLKK